jgi:hypothetical protein
MAQRPVFIPRLDSGKFLLTESIEFKWFPGFSLSQKRKCIEALHIAAQTTLDLRPILEISSKSHDPLGVKLSAFNLCLEYRGTKISVESAYQGSKVFEKGGPFEDLFLKSSKDAKKDPRLRQSGALIKFDFNREEWPLIPETSFYDWLYLNALNDNEVLAKELLKYQAFTDIEFNPKKSMSCQARSAALYVAIQKKGIFKQALSSKEKFLLLVRTIDRQNLPQQYEFF